MDNLAHIATTLKTDIIKLRSQRSALGVKIKDVKSASIDNYNAYNQALHNYNFANLRLRNAFLSSSERKSLETTRDTYKKEMDDSGYDGPSLTYLEIRHSYISHLIKLKKAMLLELETILSDDIRDEKIRDTLMKALPLVINAAGQSQYINLDTAEIIPPRRKDIKYSKHYYIASQSRIILGMCEDLFKKFLGETGPIYPSGIIYDVKKNVYIINADLYNRMFPKNKPKQIGSQVEVASTNKTIIKYINEHTASNNITQSVIDKVVSELGKGLADDTTRADDGVTNDEWTTYYEVLKEYIHEHNTYPPTNEFLGQWTLKQNLAYNAGWLTREQRNLLRKLKGWGKIKRSSTKTVGKSIAFKFVYVQPTTNDTLTERKRSVGYVYRESHKTAPEGAEYIGDFYRLVSNKGYITANDDTRRALMNGAIINSQILLRFSPPPLPINLPPSTTPDDGSLLSKLMRDIEVYHGKSENTPLPRTNEIILPFPVSTIPYSNIIEWRGFINGELKGLIYPVTLGNLKKYSIRLKRVHKQLTLILNKNIHYVPQDAVEDISYYINQLPVDYHRDIKDLAELGALKDYIKQLNDYQDALGISLPTFSKLIVLLQNYEASRYLDGVRSDIMKTLMLLPPMFHADILTLLKTDVLGAFIDTLQLAINENKIRYETLIKLAPDTPSDSMVVWLGGDIGSSLSATSTSLQIGDVYISLTGGIKIGLYSPAYQSLSSVRDVVDSIKDTNEPIIYRKYRIVSNSSMAITDGLRYVSEAEKTFKVFLVN